MNVTDKYDLVVMFGLDTSLKNTANFLCKLLIEANTGKVERAIEEAAARCAGESEYIIVSEDKEVVEEPVRIRRRKAR